MCCNGQHPTTLSSQCGMWHTYYIHTHGTTGHTVSNRVSASHRIFIRRSRRSAAVCRHETERNMVCVASPQDHRGARHIRVEIAKTDSTARRIRRPFPLISHSLMGQNDPSAALALPVHLDAGVHWPPGSRGSTTKGQQHPTGQRRTRRAALKIPISFTHSHLRVYRQPTD